MEYKLSDYAGYLALPLKILQTYLKEFKGKCDIIIEEAIGGQRFPYFAGLYIKEPLIAVWHQKHEKIFYRTISISNFTFPSSNRKNCLQLSTENE